MFMKKDGGLMATVFWLERLLPQAAGRFPPRPMPK
jgi:hypothetical protein